MPAADRRQLETTGVLPAVPHSATSRTVPARLTDSQRALLASLLDQDTRWIRRDDWLDFLAGSDAGTNIDDLTADQRSAAVAWLRQQRHELYRATEGGTRAPDGWLESLPLYQRLADH